MCVCMHVCMYGYACVCMRVCVCVMYLLIDVAAESKRVKLGYMAVIVCTVSNTSIEKKERGRG